MPRRARPSAGYSLIELLMVITLMGILAALVLPSANPSIHSRLEGAARIVAADLAYGRSLAVANNSRYRFTFDLVQNRYTLEHTGSNSALDALPPDPLHPSAAPATQQTVDLDDLPIPGGARLAAVVSVGAGTKAETDVEFGPLGETTRAEETVVWLAAGSGNAERLISVHVNPVTGLATVGDFQGSP